MSPKNIDSLKEIAKSNQVMNDVLHDFALRQRARGQVTVRALYQRMKKEGFKHEQKDYATVLRDLASLGFGVLRKTSRGNVSGLFEISKTLKSIGELGVGKTSVPKSFHKRTKYGSITTITPGNTTTPTETIVKELQGVSKLIHKVLEDDTVSVEKRINALIELMR